jgi:hypothetical protein
MSPVLNRTTLDFGETAAQLTVESPRPPPEPASEDGVFQSIQGRLSIHADLPVGPIVPVCLSCDLRQVP